MGQWLILLFGCAFVCFAIGVPVGVSLGLGILVLIAVNPITSITYVAQQLYSGLDSLPILAIPCFMLSGAVMQVGGISKRLIRAANSLIGNFYGGLGLVTIVACLFFGAISGSASATVVAIGSIMIPEMVKGGYPKIYATGLIAVAGGLGSIIPPSIPMIIYGTSTSSSIGDMFLAGFFPGILIGIFLGVINWLLSKKNGYISKGNKFSIRNTASAIWDAKFALAMPIIILGGIYGGIFTPTEAAIVSVVYGIIVSLFIHKEIKIKELIKLTDSNTTFVGGIMMTFAPAAALGGVFSLLQVQKGLTDLVASINPSQFIVLLIVNVILLIIGMLLDSTSAIVIFAPLIVAILKPFNMSPIHIGIIMIVNLCVGYVTPPMALNLFVASGLTKQRMDQIAKAAIPFALFMIMALLLITYIPQISLGIFTLFGR